jgi:hypothetical protein
MYFLVVKVYLSLELLAAYKTNGVVFMNQLIIVY